MQNETNPCPEALSARRRWAVIGDIGTVQGLSEKIWYNSV